MEAVVVARKSCGRLIDVPQRRCDRAYQRFLLLETSGEAFINMTPSCSKEESQTLRRVSLSPAVRRKTGSAELSERDHPFFMWNRQCEPSRGPEPSHVRQAGGARVNRPARHKGRAASNAVYIKKIYFDGDSRKPPERLPLHGM